jgi:hypothetical protein
MRVSNKLACVSSLMLPFLPLRANYSRPEELPRHCHDRDGHRALRCKFSCEPNRNVDAGLPNAEPKALGAIIL